MVSMLERKTFREISAIEFARIHCLLCFEMNVVKYLDWSVVGGTMEHIIIIKFYRNEYAGI